MDCREWENQLDDLLAGRLAVQQRLQVEEHLAACPACAELFATAQGNRNALSTPDQTDLTEAVLARTSGPACGRSEELLCDLVAGDLPGGDAQLVRMHLEHCQPCAALQRTLTWVVPLLPQMATITPDRRFTVDVLGRTSRAHGFRVGLRRQLWGERLRDWWQGAVARPRFNLEAAYVGTVLLIALFGTPYSPLKEAPPRALEIVQAGPQGIASSLAPGYRVAAEAVGQQNRAFWDATGGRVEHVTRDVTGGLNARWERTASARADLGRHGEQLGQAMMKIDFTRAALHLRGVGQDLERIWQQWRGHAYSVKKNENNRA